MASYELEKEAIKTEEEFNKIHRDKELPSDMPIFEIDKKFYDIINNMVLKDLDNNIDFNEINDIFC